MDLENLFNPSSIAIVGASRETHKVGYLVAKNIIDQGYLEKLYLVNNKHSGKILGREVYPSLSLIKKPIDLAILAVPGGIALRILDEMIELNIKNAVLYGAGFKESGKDGEKMEGELLSKAKKNKINILGPNCLGFVNTKSGINATFLKNRCPKGNIGFISQSGALGSYLNDYFSGHINLGFSHFISIGNKTVVDEVDCLEFLVQDKNTDVIGMYLEDIKNGDDFQKMAKKISQIKPIIVLKSGTTTQGSRAALSHTGGMIGDDQVYEAVFRQSGIIRAKSLGEFLTLLKLFSYKKIPANKSTLILSNAGGAGVLLTDELIENNLEMKTISQRTIKELINSFDETKKISIHNPIDLLGDASAFDYKTVIETTVKEKDIGSVIVLLTPQANTEILKTAKIIIEIQRHFSHPIYPIFMGKKSMVGVGKLFEENKIAGFANFDFLPKALSQILWWNNTVKKDEMSEILAKLNNIKNQTSNIKTTNQKSKIKNQQIHKILSLRVPKERGNLRTINIVDSLKILQLCGIQVEPIHLITSEKDLKQISEKIGFPVVAKIVSDKISHKTEVGGVITNIKTYEELKPAYGKLFRYIDISKSLGYVGVQKMVKGHEILIGAKQDKIFGPVIIFGLGGVYTELLREISYLVYPFTYEQFVEKINNCKLARLIQGFRNQAPINQKKLFETADLIGQLMINFPEIKEIDINPLIASDKNISAVDARIII